MAKKRHSVITFTILLIIVVIALIFLLTKDFSNRIRDPSIIEINDKRIVVEVVDTFAERSQGLMYRESLAENTGMLFVFHEEKQRSFWMKHTFIPLDLIFINKHFVIVDIKEDFQPCKKDPCHIYDSPANSMYVLEMNAGFVQENNIVEGDKIKLN